MPDDPSPEVSDEIFKIRPFRPDAYGESHLETLETKARMDIARLVAWASVILLALITVSSLWIFAFGVEGKRMEEATRFITLIIGAILGATFRSTNSPDR